MILQQSRGLLVLVGLLITIVATYAPKGFAIEDRETDHEALRELRVITEEAVNTNQLDLLRPHLAEGFSIVTYTDREFTDFDAFVAQWQKTRDELLAGGSYTTRLIPKLSEIEGDTAIAKGTSENVLVTGNGSTYQFASHWTAVCRKIDGTWKIVRAHSSLDPFGNPMVASAFRDAAIKIGLCAAVVGLVLGWVAHLLFARMRKQSTA